MIRVEGAFCQQPDTSLGAPVVAREGDTWQSSTLLKLTIGTFRLSQQCRGHDISGSVAATRHRRQSGRKLRRLEGGRTSCSIIPPDLWANLRTHIDNAASPLPPYALVRKSWGVLHSFGGALKPTSLMFGRSGPNARHQLRRMARARGHAHRQAAGTRTNHRACGKDDAR
jgi:hypothetical protein